MIKKQKITPQQQKIQVQLSLLPHIKDQKQRRILQQWIEWQQNNLKTDIVSTIYNITTGEYKKHYPHRSYYFIVQNNIKRKTYKTKSDPDPDCTKNQKKKRGTYNRKIHPVQDAMQSVLYEPIPITKLMKDFGVSKQCLMQTTRFDKHPHLGKLHIKNKCLVRKKPLSLRSR